MSDCTNAPSKMHQIRFREDPAVGAYSATPDPSLDLRGLLLRGGGREGRGGEGREEEGMEGRGGEWTLDCLPPRFDNPGYGPGRVAGFAVSYLTVEK